MNGLEDSISLAEAATSLGLDPSGLRTQATKGRIKAKLVGRVWVTTRQEVERYRQENLGKLGRPISLDRAWREAEEALPDGYYISNVRSRSKGGRWSASATLAHDLKGASFSGFGPSPVRALLALAERAKQLKETA